MDGLPSFFVENFPTTKTIVVGTPNAFIWVWTCLYFSGHLKVRQGLKTGYTRKVFHFLIFGSACAVHLVWGLPKVFLFGTITSLVVFFAVWRGSGFPGYEAMAREADAPHRTYYIIIPYFATLMGGITTNILFGSLAVVGYLIAGLGDAMGEPVGTRFGKHTYRVPSFFGGTSLRSYEGSLSVVGVSFLAILVWMWLRPDFGLNLTNIVMIAILAMACGVLEAVSPRGWDNAVMQIVPTWLVAWWF